MLIRAEEAIQKANRLVRQCGTRNADRIARELGLIVMPRDFSRQKGDIWSLNETGISLSTNILIP